MKKRKAKTRGKRPAKAAKAKGKPKAALDPDELPPALSALRVKHPSLHILGRSTGIVQPRARTKHR